MGGRPRANRKIWSPGRQLAEQRKGPMVSHTEATLTIFIAQDSVGQEFEHARVRCVSEEDAESRGILGTWQD